MLNYQEFQELVSLDKKGLLTDEQSLILEPYKVKRAVFFAAGFGSRLVPLTLEKPKPLIKVNGVRIIDTLLDAVLEAGIDDITIVRGYKKECLDELLDKYPMIQFVDNDDYDKANNISSAHLVRDLFQNTIVLESDLVLYNASIIEKYVYHSFYMGIETESSDDWCFKTKGSQIESVHIGGHNVYQMVGISYWNKKDGMQLSHDLEEFYSSEEGKNRFWDEVSLIDYKGNYQVHVKGIQFEDIIEIDTYDELKEIDSTYK